jgi:hypothetical protein
MSSKINVLIGRQNYELIRNRIGEILIEELDNQFTVLGNTFAKAIVTVEGNNVVDSTEMSKVLVSLQKGNFNNEHYGESTGLFIFNIDCFCKSKSSDIVDGSSNAAFKAQALAGIIRYIIRDPWYNTLGFTPGFIGNVTVSEIQIGESDPKDLLNTVGARVQVQVKCIESNSMPTPTLMNNYQTSVVLGTSAQGYLYNTPTV